ncbi:hypothetical protein L210DRAFT_3503957 [Boletus edulis BED1]|uniref:Uncharacterized protein n=1 Tax=Boletus edulis BED1 TaxID=1328754 RepID=A0AAD4BUD5_BOLED|nr:hypothetical protein L210DRAFT_3503957 [Boletus edulis BED1]
MSGIGLISENPSSSMGRNTSCQVGWELFQKLDTLLDALCQRQSHTKLCSTKSNLTDGNLNTSSTFLVLQKIRGQQWRECEAGHGKPWKKLSLFIELEGCGICGHPIRLVAQQSPVDPTVVVRSVETDSRDIWPPGMLRYIDTKTFPGGCAIERHNSVTRGNVLEKNGCKVVLATKLLEVGRRDHVVEWMV